MAAPTIKASIRRGFLRQIAAQAAANGLTLGESLNGFQSNVWSDSFKAGRVYISTSGSGQSASFVSIPNFLLGSQGEIMGLAEEFITLYNDVLTQQALLSNPLTDDGSAPNTNAILAEMLADISMQPIRVAGADYTILGWPQVGATMTGQ